MSKIVCTRDQARAFLLDAGVTPRWNSYIIADDGDGIQYIAKWNEPKVNQPTAKQLARFTESVAAEIIKASKLQCTPAQLTAFLSDRGITPQLSGLPTDSFIVSDEGDGVQFLSSWNVPGVEKPTAATLAAYTPSVSAQKIAKLKKDAYATYSDTLPQVEPLFDLVRRILWKVFQTKFDMTKAEITAIEKEVWDEWQDGTPYQK